MFSKENPKDSDSKIIDKRVNPEIGLRLRTGNNLATRLQVQEMYIRGYPTHRILEAVNERRKNDGFRPIKIVSLYKIITQMKSEDSEWYLHLMKNQMAYISLYRDKLSELSLLKSMVYDKIKNEGGTKQMPASLLIRAVGTLREIIETQSGLERQLPYIQGMINNAKGKSNTPEAVREMEAEIIATMSEDKRKVYEEQRALELKKIEEQYEKDPTGGNVNLSELQEDTYII